MIYKLCRRCKMPIIHPNAYCSKCRVVIENKQVELQRERDRRYNKRRDPKYKQFYNSNEWKVLKEKKLQDEQNLCERCSKLAVEVHHIKYIQTEEGWPLRPDYDSLEVLCTLRAFKVLKLEYEYVRETIISSPSYIFFADFK